MSTYWDLLKEIRVCLFFSLLLHLGTHVFHKKRASFMVTQCFEFSIYFPIPGLSLLLFRPTDPKFWKRSPVKREIKLVSPNHTETHPNYTEIHPNYSWFDLNVIGKYSHNWNLLQNTVLTVHDMTISTRSPFLANFQLNYAKLINYAWLRHHLSQLIAPYHNKASFQISAQTGK